MRIFFHELSEEPKHLKFTQADAWVQQSVQETWESTELPSSQESPEYKVEFDLHRSQDIIFLRGKLSQVGVELLCSRCATPFFKEINGQFSGMYSRSRDYAEKEGNVGVAYSEPTGNTEDDAEIELLDKDYLELADALKEQIYLKIPLQPLCKEDCKGLCPTCGQNQNTHPCQCHRIREGALAKALAKSKIRID